LLKDKQIRIIHSLANMVIVIYSFQTLDNINEML